jgi:phosphoribosyl 1,2-cyclic phosphodiesterase
MTLDVIATGSTGNCYIITAGTDKLLLDCGISYKRIQTALGFDTAHVSGCLVTHEHNDHSKAILDLTRAGIYCYMTQGTAETKGVTGHRIRHVTAAQTFTVGQFTVYPFKTEHDAADPVGFLISYKPTGERLLYATDTYYLRYAFKGVHYMMVECNYCNDIVRTRLDSGDIAKARHSRLMSSHFSLDNLKGFLDASDLTATRHIVLVHMSDGNSDERRMVREIHRLTGISTTAAVAGLRIKLELRPF